MAEKFCDVCGRWVDGAGKFCSERCRDSRSRSNRGTIYSRHNILLRILEDEGCPTTDPLRSLNYYEQILLSNNGLCVYDEAPISPSGIALDRIDCKKSHTAANVIGPVCGFCNMLRRDILSVEEMLFLKPQLIELRERREMAAPKHRKALYSQNPRPQILEGL